MLRFVVTPTNIINNGAILSIIFLQFEEALGFLTSNQKTASRQYYSEYLRILQKQNKREVLLEEAEKMHLLYSDSSVALEWICKIYNESYIEKNHHYLKVEHKINEYCEKLLEIQPDSSMAHFTKGIMLFGENKITEAVALLNKGLLYSL